MEYSESQRNSEKYKFPQQGVQIQGQKNVGIPYTHYDPNLNNHISLYPNQYGQPIVIQSQSNTIIVNQLPLKVIPSNLELDPTELQCPYCLNKVITLVEKKFSCCTCLLYFLTIALCAIPCVIIMGFFNTANDFCTCSCRDCHDSTHRCPVCKQVIGLHDSCPCSC